MKLLPRAVQNNHSCLPALASLFKVVPRECRAHQALLQTLISTRARSHTARPLQAKPTQPCTATPGQGQGEPLEEPSLPPHVPAAVIHSPRGGTILGGGGWGSVKTNKTQTLNISQALIVGNLTQVLTVATYSEGALDFRLQRGSQPSFSCRKTQTHTLSFSSVFRARKIPHSQKQRRSPTSHMLH